MKRKGYIFSLFVFLLFVPILLLVVSNAKSVVVMQDSNYEKISIMKASRMIKNIYYFKEMFYDTSINPGSDQDHCVHLRSVIETPANDLPMNVALKCPDEVCPGSSARIEISTYSGNYKYTIPLPGC